jgi:hypothetical protein
MGDEEILGINTILPASFQRSDDIRRIKWSERRQRRMKEIRIKKAKMKAEKEGEIYLLTDKKPPDILRKRMKFKLKESHDIILPLSEEEKGY